MTSRERIVSALNFRVPDRVPVLDFLFSRRFMKEIYGYTTDLYDGSVQTKLATEIGLDGVYMFINGYPGFEEEPHREGETYYDEWGVKYVKNGWPVMVQTEVALKGRKDWEKYIMPKPDAAHRLNMVNDAIKANTGDLAIICAVLGPFTMAYWYFFDLATLSLLIYDDPSLLHEVNETFVDWTLKTVQLIKDRGGVDAICVADDWGGTNALLMSPAHLREFFMPPFRKMVQGIKALGFPVLMHNDGNLWAVLDDLVGTGINGYHPVERGASMDLGIVKGKYGGRLCPVGNINNKTTMVFGTPEDVKQEAIECLKTAAPGGGYILATDHSI
ncbi:MAG: hypothetical protein E4H36_07110, partial [Spirochaetales bacterium]